MTFKKLFSVYLSVRASISESQNESMRQYASSLEHATFVYVKSSVVIHSAKQKNLTLLSHNGQTDLLLVKMREKFSSRPFKPLYAFCWI